MSVARDEHSMQARELLRGVDQLQDELEGLTPDRRLELAVAGAMPSLNADLRFTVELAIAHALTAIAVALEERTP